MGTICTSGVALAKAGKNVSGDIDGIGWTPTSQFEKWILQAESTINSMTRYNWTDDYGSLSVDVKYILEDVCASLTAINCIAYDMSGYTTRTEAEDMINILRDSVLRNISVLRDIKVQSFMQGAT